MAVYAFLDLAYDVLKATTNPLTYQEIWQIGKENGLVDKIKTSGKTPWQSLGSQLYVEVRDNENSRFIKVGRRPQEEKGSGVFSLTAEASWGNISLCHDVLAKLPVELSITR